MTTPYPLYSNITVKEDMKIYPFLETLIYTLAEKNPSWTFEQSWTRWENNVRYAGEFKVSVTATKELLGEIGVDTRRHPDKGRENVYTVANERISRSRDRGRALKSSKIKEVIKAINKNFHAETIKERIDKAWVQAEWHLMHSHRNTYSELEDVRAKLGKVALSVVRRTHWDTFMQVLTEVSPELAKSATELDELIEQHNKAEDLHSKFQSKNLLTVIIDDGKYIVSDNSGNMRTYTSDDLPEQVKQQVGMLKLVEEKAPIPGVGLRVGDMYLINAAI